jgi:hypothetical protein
VHETTHEHKRQTAETIVHVCEHTIAKQAAYGSWQTRYRDFLFATHTDSNRTTPERPHAVQMYNIVATQQNIKTMCLCKAVKSDSGCEICIPAVPCPVKWRRSNGAGAQGPKHRPAYKSHLSSTPVQSFHKQLYSARDKTSTMMDTSNSTHKMAS